MNLEVKIDAEAVQAQIVQAIMNSTIGANIEKYIGEALTRTPGGFGDYRNIVQRAIDDAVAIQIRSIATEMMQEKREQIREQMLAKLTDVVLAKMADAAWAVMEGKLRVAA